MKDPRFVEIREAQLSKSSRSSLGGSPAPPTATISSSAPRSIKRIFEAIKISDIQVCGDYAQFNAQLSNGKHSWIPKGELVVEDKQALVSLIQVLSAKLQAAKEELERLEDGNGNGSSFSSKRKKAKAAPVESSSEENEDEDVDIEENDSVIDRIANYANLSSDVHEEEQEDVGRLLRLQDQKRALESDDQEEQSSPKRAKEDPLASYTRNIIQSSEQESDDDTLDFDGEEESEEDLPSPDQLIGDMFMTQAKDTQHQPQTQTQILPSMVQESDVSIVMPISITAIEEEAEEVVESENKRPVSPPNDDKRERKLKIVKSLEAVREHPETAEKCTIM